MVHRENLLISRISIPSLPFALATILRSSVIVAGKICPPQSSGVSIQPFREPIIIINLFEVFIVSLKTKNGSKTNLETNWSETMHCIAMDPNFKEVEKGLFDSIELIASYLSLWNPNVRGIPLEAGLIWNDRSNFWSGAVQRWEARGLRRWGRPWVSRSVGSWPPTNFLLPLSTSFHYLLSTKVAMPTMVAPNLPTAPSLPCLKTDLCPDRSLEAETAGLKMVTKKWQIGSFWGRRPNVFFLYRTIWDAHCIDQTSSDWYLLSSTFVCLPNILLWSRKVMIGW